MKFLSRSALLCLFSLWPSLILAANPLDVVISEIAWMGNAASPDHEWIELTNNMTSTVPVDNWTLKSADGSINVSLIGLILARSFYFFERTDEDTVPEVVADHIYVGALGNKGELLELRDAAGNLIDKIDALAGWPAGDNSSKQTMVRKNLTLPDGPDNWGDSADPGGTPRSRNNLAPSINPALPKPDIKQQILSPSENIPEKEIEIFNRNNPSLRWPYFLASGLAIFSGFVIVFLKRKVKKF